MVPNTSDDLPDPETPVNTVSLRLGISMLTSFRLFTRAPWTRIRSWRFAVRWLEVAMLPIMSPSADGCNRRGVRLWLSMFRMMQFPEATTRDPEIDVWLTKHPDELHAIAQRWLTGMRQCGSDVRELMHDGHPTACVHDAAFGYVDIFKKHVNVGFFCGTELKDPARLLEGTGKFMRHVKVKPGFEIN